MPASVVRVLRAWCRGGSFRLRGILLCRSAPARSRRRSRPPHVLPRRAAGILPPVHPSRRGFRRTEEPRVGHMFVSPFSTTLSPYHYKQKTQHPTNIIIPRNQTIISTSPLFQLLLL